MKPLSIEQLIAQNRELVDTIKTLQIENQKLKAQIEYLNRRLFGPSSEKLDPNQPVLGLNIPESEVGKSEASSEPTEEASPKAGIKRDRSPKKLRQWEHLPVEETVLVPLEVQADPESYVQTGKEESDQLAIVPAKVYIERTVRPAFKKKDDLDATPFRAPLPSKLQNKCIAANSLITHVAVLKYVYHLSLYRIQTMFKVEHQIDITRTTLCRWMALCAFWFESIYEQIRKEIEQSGYVQVDETPVSYLVPGNGKTKKGYFWVARSPSINAVYFVWKTSRSGSCVYEILSKDFVGILQRDGYRAYDAYARENPHVAVVSCLAHIRRAIYDSRQQDPRISSWILAQIQKIYLIEAELREKNATPKQRYHRRQKETVVLMRRLEKVFKALVKKRRFLPKSGLGKALAYALDEWPHLQVFVNSGDILPDNNPVENAIRPTSVGKKNWLFIGSATAGRVSAILYTIVENCRIQGVDPREYMLDLLSRMPTATTRDIPKMTPAAWARARRQTTEIPLAKAA